MTKLYTVVLIIWLVFWSYWIFSATSAKKNIKSGAANSRFILIRLFVFFVLLILFSLHGFKNDTFLNQRLAKNNILLLIGGFTLFISGLAFAVWARINLGKNWGFPMSLKQNPKLVTEGPYKYVRHPIYTGIIFASFGTAVIGINYWLIISIIFIVYFIYSAKVEETLMSKEFPNKYPKYIKQTKMIIPFIF